MTKWRGVCDRWLQIATNVNWDDNVEIAKIARPPRTCVTGDNILILVNLEAMKIIAPVILFLTIHTLAYSQKTKDFGLLKKVDEQVIFSFKLKTNNKIALLCRQKNNKYLVYRFGANDKIDLQYPAVLNSASWKLFKYSGYSRGGGPQNSAEEEHSISFINNGSIYKIYDNWASIYKEKGECGIIVKMDGRETKLAGNVRSKTGALGVLREYEDLIPNNYWEESQ